MYVLGIFGALAEGAVIDITSHGAIPSDDTVYKVTSSVHSLNE
jgi:hypothetical protein